MPSVRNYLVLTSLVFVTTCVSTPQEFSKISQAQQKERVAELINSGWSFKLGKSIKDIKQSLGKPLRENIEDYQNPHVENQIDEIHILDYGGLMIHVYRANEKPPRDILYRLIITDDDYEMKWGLGIGSTRKEVELLFGKSDRIEDENTNSVSFSFSNDKIDKIEWNWYLD